MTFIAHAVEFLLIAGLLVVAALGVAFLVARAYVRRHWRLVQGHVAYRGFLAGLSVLAAGRERFWARLTPEQLSRGTSARVRRRMWVAVEDAERAVAHADGRDAPVADLPAVCRSLRGVAGELDGLLRHERRLPSGVGRSDGVRAARRPARRCARSYARPVTRSTSCRAGSRGCGPSRRRTDRFP